MQKAKVVDGANPDGTANDETIYQPANWNDNTFNLFKLVEAAGYTLIDADLSQLTKAVKGPYVDTFTYNTSFLPSQSVNDVVRGSDGKYYEVQNNAVIGDDPVGSVTGNWVQVPFDKLFNDVVEKDSPTGSAILPLGTTAERSPTPLNGYIRYNSDLGTFEGYSNGSWGSIGGGATGNGSDAVFYLNDQIVTTDYTIPVGQNAMTAGDITIATGVTVTVSSGSKWSIV